jgi:4-diphosphocytidyl-2-C-methyl-D-erythritol kinase
MIIDAHAKLNLSLRILAREASGFHQIETLFCAVDLCDELEVERRTSGIDLRVRADHETTKAIAQALNSSTRDNIVYKAAGAFFDATRLDGGADITLTKRIPSGAGMGGGSSDAAATLVALNELYARPLDRDALLQLGAKLGSDVPFFMCGSPLALAWGRGTRLMPLPALAAKPVVLAVSAQTVATADAYQSLAASRGDSYVAPSAIIGATPDTSASTRISNARSRDANARVRDKGVSDGWAAVAFNAVNDFESVIFSKIPELAQIKADLARHGARVAMMTGSGSVVFGVFDEDARADDAAAAVRTDFRNVTTIITRTADRDVSLWAPPASLT